MRKDVEAGALLLRLPDGLPGLYAPGLGRPVFGQDDAMALLHISTHGQGLATELRVMQFLDAGVAGV